MGKSGLMFCMLILCMLFVLPAVVAEGAEADKLSELDRRVSRLEAGGAGASGGSDALKLYWKNGLHMDSPDGEFQLQIGGLVQGDWAFIGNGEDGTEFRRARLFVSGLIYDSVKFKAEYDLAGGDADFKDVWVAMSSVPVVGNVKIGHFREPLGFDQLTSCKYTFFLERALTDVFSPARNSGVMVSDKMFDSQATWALGVFKETNDAGMGTGDGEYAVTGRVTVVPWSGEEALLHVGASASHRDAGGETVRYRQRPEAHLAAYLVDTGAIAADDVFLYGGEVGFVAGSFSFQGEYVLAEIDATGAVSRPNLHGYYAQAGYFLTGESRPYSRSSGTFGRVKPNQNFTGKGGGPGAWEVVARYSNLDLNDGAAAGGELDDVTLGVNWHLNPNTKVMCNYVNADLEGTGKTDIVQLRFQLDF